MKTNAFRSWMAVAVVGALLGVAGCNRGTRANAEHQAASPAEGGGTLTEGSAGDPKNFGDTQAKAKSEGTSPSASPTGQSKDAKAGQTGGAVNPPSTKTERK